MLGILVQLVLSWAILKWYGVGDLSVLGLKPNGRRLTQSVFFLAVSAVCAVSGYMVRLYFGKEVWVLNPDLSASLVWKGIWWNFSSVMFEELIFRGVLLWILMERLGQWKGILISSTAFGIYHWFSFEVVGQPAQMTMVFFVTALAGVVYAYAFAKTGSIWIPAAIHFGWNFTRNFVFSEGQIGKGILVLKEQPVVEVSSLVWYMAVWNPTVVFVVLHLLLLRGIRQKQA